MKACLMIVWQYCLLRWVDKGGVSAAWLSSLCNKRLVVCVTGGEMNVNGLESFNWILFLSHMRCDSQVEIVVVHVKMVVENCSFKGKKVYLNFVISFIRVKIIGLVPQ